MTLTDSALNPDTPNILLICCDHLRADWLGINGHPLVMTPQIDKIACQGTNFPAAMSECPVCVPARRVLMTGLNPYAIHMNQNRDLQPFPEGPKLAELLTRAGYQTFASGKLHTCPQRNRIGFEDVQLNEEGRRQDSPAFVDDYEAFLNDSGYGHLAYTHGLGNNQYGMRLSPLPETHTTTHWTAQKALEFLGRRDPTRPFFLYVSFDKPHPPITPPPAYYDLYRDVEFPHPAWGDWVERKAPPRFRAVQQNHLLDSGGFEHPLLIQQTLRGFAAMITHIDSMVGVLVGELRERGLLENTHILFTSDHGDHLFDHGDLAKTDFFRGSANIPYIIRPAPAWARTHTYQPGGIDAAAPVGLMDILPTILDLCNLPIPATVEGQSLVPRLLNRAAPFRPFSFGNCASAYAASDGRYKYIWQGESGLEYLFDTHTDPHELHDLAESPSHQEALAGLRAALLAWLQTHHDPHAGEGILTVIPTEPLDAPGRAFNLWNNRGRH